MHFVVEWVFFTANVLRPKKMINIVLKNLNDVYNLQRFFFIFKYFVDNEYMKNKPLVVGWIFFSPLAYLTNFLNAYIPSSLH